jgi:hypothetical protein
MFSFDFDRTCEEQRENSNCCFTLLRLAKLSVTRDFIAADRKFLSLQSWRDSIAHHPPVVKSPLQRPMASGLPSEL